MLDFVGTALAFIGYTLLGLSLSLIAIWIWIRPYRLSLDVPGPKRHFLFGTTFGFEEDGEGSADKKKKQKAFDWGHWPTLSLEISRKHQFRTWGSPTLNIGFGPCFFNVVSPECLDYVLQNPDLFVKGKLTASFDEIIGVGTFTTDGQLWKYHRKITVSILNRDAVRYTSTVLCKKLKRLQSYLAANEGQIVDFQTVSYKLILDVLFEWAFGIDSDQFASKSDEEVDADDTSSRLIDTKELTNVIDAFDRLQLYTHQRFNDLFWQFKQRYVIGERERCVKECKKILDDFSYKLIQESRRRQQQQQNQQTYQREDIISRFLKYSQDNDIPCTDKDLRDFCMLFLLAGRDSTSAALTWTMFELTRHPDWVLSIRDEVDSILNSEKSESGRTGDEGNPLSEPENFEIDNVHKMKTVHAVVMEALRLHSPAPDNFRFANRSTTLPDGTFVPATALVMFSPYTINHSEQVWGQHADDFDPRRWLKHDGSIGHSCLEPSPSRFPTFGLGPRICPGRNLALMELKMTVAFLCCNFDFVDEAGHDGDYLWTIVMSMKDGFPVRVTKRR